MLACMAQFLVRRREKVIIRRVTALCFRALMCLVAGIVSWLSSMRMHTLDLGYLRQCALAGIVDNVEEQPRNGIWIQRIDVSSHFARHLAAILQFPGRPCE